MRTAKHVDAFDYVGIAESRTLKADFNIRTKNEYIKSYDENEEVRCASRCREG